jgi:Helicase conserved C-terminal domain
MERIPSMANDPRQMAVEAALAGLKDFQRATVEAVYKRLFASSQKSMLVADEVGLGKTIVAKGLIAMALRERIQRGDVAPFKVTYVCSNQVIAGENIGKLNVFPDVDLADTVVHRIAYLAYAPRESDNPFPSSLVLNTLTPGTSFEVSGGTGTKYERAIIYSLLCADPKMESVRNGLACLLRGTVQQHIDGFRDWMEGKRGTPLRDGLAESFLSSIRNRTLKLKEAPLTRELLGMSEDRNPSIFDATYQMASILRSNNEANHRRACNEVARVLRRTLIDACLKYIDADLFILDEFQRFRNLIDPDSDAEEAEIARRVFQNRKARILLLSATPFKAFTGDMDLSNGEDHYRDFRTVLRFLTNDDTATLDEYEQHRRALYHQLFSLQKGSLNVSPEHRKEIERILRSVMCRTERQIVAADPGAMILDKWRQGGIPFGLPDIRNYVATDQIAAALSKAYQGRRHVIGNPIEYCKSAPHPLSYLDGYALKKLLKEFRRNESVRTILKQNRDAWLDTRGTNRYTLRVGRTEGQSGTNAFAHARLASLVEESIGANGAKLLWIPPSLPYYQLGGGFKNAAGFSKVLVFSGWVMVPRMIASLLSYEVERQTVGDPATRESRETATRCYFTPRNKPNYKRHPVPLLVYRAEDGDAATAKSMSNFCCLYPCLTLANAYDPILSFQPTASVEQVRQDLAKRIAEMIKIAGLAKYESSAGSPDRWYWAAPPLLDHADPALKRSISYWLHDNEFLERSAFFQVQDREESAKLRHFTAFRDAFCLPENLSLGRMPADLPEVLADMALGSPAVIALRTFGRLFPDAKGKITKQHLRGAFEVAGEFLNLFNKPESICALRLTTDSADYWRQLLRYCGDGCLQAVMDEYGHLTKGQKGTMDATITRLRETINITATSINVDSLPSFLRGRPHKMRCHYAVDFGNQKLETEQGQERATSIRENFNSPFRPFVLATTSIGQEGLDFHQYCRKVVHWNLPGNPIDLEQREGRINRYKGLVIRQEIARKYSSKLPGRGGYGDVWDTLFEIADQEERAKYGKCELVPYWHVDTNGIKIDRIIPMYPFSRDQGKLGTILKTLAIYRLAFGQPRQVELIEHLLEKQFDPEEIEAIRKNLMINLSPISYCHDNQ